MKTMTITLLLSLMLLGCKSEPSLEKYFVENTENKNFVQIDISPSVLNLEKSKLTAAQINAVKSFDKMNVLAFKVNENNKAQFDIERGKVIKILKEKKYQELMKFGSGKDGGSVSFVGNEDHISEFVFFGNKKEAGFAVVRILGKDMNPNAIIDMANALQKSNVNLDELKPLVEMIKK